MTPKQSKPNKPVNRRAKYDWNEITIQFLTSDHADFRAFLLDMGLPLNLMKSPNARSIGEKKRSIIAQQTERVRQAVLADPIRQREQRKFTVLKELEQAGRALQAVIMNDIIPDLELTKRRDGEAVEKWMERLRAEDVVKFRLTPGEKMALSVAMKHADELIRRAAGLEDFDWDHAERNAQAVAKAGRLEFEIVKTSGARPLDQLPHAVEDDVKKEVG